ncbi:helix-turn-helix domain-containing protein [Streptomyces scopuliridis]|uniref:Helix-turn-helix domain-containing protein n=1 Tax=Streptomyces scopuliridis TaxID=452529 RepID=A0ACD4ZVW9_9ACTN|nr:helix-turn-helix domain-containing protein [Streptomyces scopuliridis]WSC02365.1 helix-turn-helix domain-containing protein [Streptomyces scopuliridis]WSC04098.1 helix-turn-helix domain-containing protein [Streptomyces scopuliridis]
MASEFGDVLRRLRVRAGLTQEGLAEHSGVSVRTIRGLETGTRSNPRMTTVQELATALPLGPREREELLGAAVRRNQDGGQQDESAMDEPGPEEPASEEPGSEEPRSAQSASGQPASPAHDAADATEQLAKAVAARWQREEEQRQIQDPFPLPVRRQAAPEELTDHWANILRLPAGAAADPLDLNGELDGIAELYRSIPSGRLVVLGRSGSGKTILALRFVLDRLTSRTPAEPVPVIFSIGAWNPTAITLRDWLTGQLTRDHPGYAAQGPDKTTLASALVESGRVLPVLDGFDEIADGLRRPALEALNATTLPLLLTSRPAEYAAAVAETDVLTSAAALELINLTLDDLSNYLPRTTRKPGRANPAGNAWDPVLTTLREQPQDQPASPLAAVLANPLMVALARTIYSDTPDHDPASLLDTERFGSPDELEDHLLDNFIPTVYRRRLPQAPGTRPHPTFDPERARHWLGYLAHHLNRLETPDLAWWRLGGGLRRSTRTLVTALVTGLVIGLVDCAIATALGASFPFPIVDGTVVGLLSGLMFGLAHWLTFGVKDIPVTPSVVRLRIRGRPGTIRWKAGPRLVIGMLGGLVFGLGYGFVFGVMNSKPVWKAGLSTVLHLGLVDGIVYGLVFSGGAGLTFCLLGLLESPLDIRSAVHPRSLLNTNRGTVTTQLLVWAPTFGAVVGFGAGAVVDLLQGSLGPLIWSPAAGLALGTISGLGGALGYTLTMTAWGQWLVLSRIWLPLTGRLPWAVVAFLDDAYRRGVLRQAGAVYQFRHARLQHHLAQAHRTPPAPGRPARRR